MITKQIPHPHFTFETYVVGNSNRFAYAASRGAAESPGLVHNPLFIYSGVGLGKTHMMGAIGNYILQNKKDMQVLYVTAEWFVNELVEAFETNSIDNFRNKYRAVDCLLIDDIQFLGEEDRPQSELIHTFDTLYTLQKQIVFTSDRPPKSVTSIQERLRSRFEGGLIADIQPPDFETRVAILQKKATSKGMEIHEDIILEIAKTIKANVRELEGFLNKIAAFYSMDKSNITLDWVRQALRSHLSMRPSSIPEPFADQPQVVKKVEQSRDEFGSFIHDIEENLGGTIEDKREEETQRSNYRRKLYIWEMKGFNVIRLKRVIDSDLDKVRRAFDDFTIDVKRLMELQKQLATMDIRGLEDQVKEVERNLFDPDKLSKVEKQIKNLEIYIERRKHYKATLNQSFNFNHFVVGEANQMVAYVSKMISESPATLYNPLFIHGEIGVGKTHLLHAIGNETASHKPGFNVYYVSADTFSRNLIKAIEERKTDEFREQYSEIDVLLIDDIQVLSEKERTQEEIFHFFNALYNVRKQIVISSDRHPSRLENLHERLRSRFEGGLVVELLEPDEAARQEIIRREAQKHDVTIAQNAVEYLAEKFQTNIRELMGTLNKVFAHSRATDTTVSEMLAREILGDEIETPLEFPEEAPVIKEVLPESQPEIEDEFANINIANLLETIILDWKDERARLEMEL